MVTVHLKPCEEARIEEEEFYHMVLNSSLQEELGFEESIDDFFKNTECFRDDQRKHPPIWRDQFYDPDHKRLI